MFNLALKRYNAMFWEKNCELKYRNVYVFISLWHICCKFDARFPNFDSRQETEIKSSHFLTNGLKPTTSSDYIYSRNCCFIFHLFSNEHKLILNRIMTFLSQVHLPLDAFCVFRTWTTSANEAKIWYLFKWQMLQSSVLAKASERGLERTVSPKRKRLHQVNWWRAFFTKSSQLRNAIWFCNDFAEKMY